MVLEWPYSWTQSSCLRLWVSDFFNQLIDLQCSMKVSLRNMSSTCLTLVFDSYILYVTSIVLCLINARGKVNLQNLSITSFTIWAAWWLFIHQISYLSIMVPRHRVLPCLSRVWPIGWQVITMAYEQARRQNLQWRTIDQGALQLPGPHQAAFHNSIRPTSPLPVVWVSSSYMSTFTVSPRVSRFPVTFWHRYPGV